MKLLTTGQFKKDLKLIIRQGKKQSQIKTVIEMLLAGQRLPDKYRDHKLSGRWNKHRECHITGDWLLIYRVTDTELILERTGSHSELFG